MRRWVVAVAAVITAASGCSSNDASSPDAAAPVTVTATVTVTAEASTNTSTPSPTPAGPAPPDVGEDALQIGEWREGTGLRTQVLEVRQPERSSRPDYLQDLSEASGAVVLVRQCNGDGQEPAPVSNYYWEGSTHDGSLFTASGSSWEEWPPRPQYPTTDRNLRAGQCAKGWILLSVPDGTKLDRIAFTDGEGTAYAEWIVEN